MRRKKIRAIHLSEFTPKHTANRLKLGQNPKLMNISINYPIIYEDMIQRLIHAGIYPSRSEAIRTAIREFLYKDISFYNEIIERVD